MANWARSSPACWVVCAPDVLAPAGGSCERLAQTSGDPDLGDTYYHHWLAALERLVAEKGLVFADDMRGRRDAWEQAYLDTPHGLPVKLKKSS